MNLSWFLFKHFVFIIFFNYAVAYRTNAAVGEFKHYSEDSLETLCPLTSELVSKAVKHMVDGHTNYQYDENLISFWLKNCIPRSKEEIIQKRPYYG
uniref:Uncharacterized protein n=1 Tax=Trichobilharzia regenti TaxID=157069 RepID=A0AA85KLE0_TRIRE|nr:unnamed protein product [Trichobilharzia regenti]